MTVSPPPLRAMPERKHFFLQEGFPYFHFVEDKIFHKLAATAIFGGRIDFSAQTPHSMDSTLFLYDFSPAFDRK